MEIELKEYRLRGGPLVEDGEDFDGDAILGKLDGSIDGSSWVNSPRSMGLGLMAFTGLVDDEFGTAPKMAGDEFIGRLRKLGMDVPDLEGKVSQTAKRLKDDTVKDRKAESGDADE